MKAILTMATIALASTSVFSGTCPISKPRTQRDSYPHENGNVNYNYSMSTVTQDKDCFFKLSYPISDVMSDFDADYPQVPVNPPDEAQGNDEWFGLKIGLADLDAKSPVIKAISFLFSSGGETTAQYGLKHNSIRKCLANVAKVILAKASKTKIEAEKGICRDKIVNILKGIAADEETVVDEAAKKERALTCSEGMETFATCDYVKGNNIVDTYRVCIKEGTAKTVELKQIRLYDSGHLEVAGYEGIEQESDANGKKAAQFQFFTPLEIDSVENNSHSYKGKMFGLMTNATTDKTWTHQMNWLMHSETQVIDPETQEVKTSYKSNFGAGSMLQSGYYKCH